MVNLNIFQPSLVLFKSANDIIYNYNIIDVVLEYFITYNLQYNFNIKKINQIFSM